VLLQKLLTVLCPLLGIQVLMLLLMFF